MPVYQLYEEIAFPPIHKAWRGILAVGGDLSVERLVEAYRNGIFPWYGPEDPILWWSPNPRCVLIPKELKIRKSLQRVVNSRKFVVKFDQDFPSVIKNCAQVPRLDQEGTWISQEMQEAYIALHRAGYAHSVETYLDGVLVGGLYGVALGKVFFGESMFHHVTDASKVALYFLCKRLIEMDFQMIDAQQTTSHLMSMGAKEMKRADFKKILIKNVGDAKKTIFNKD